MGDISAPARPCSPSELAGSAGVVGYAPDHEAGTGLGWDRFDRLPGCWWVLHTRSRHEKAVAADLERHGIGHFLPLARTQRTHGRRRVTIEVPLFPGYLFLHGGDAEREAAWQTKRLANILPVRNQEQIRSELERIYCVVTSGEPVDLYPSLRTGRRCRIVAGSLRGVEGVVLRRRSMSRMYITATVLGQSAVIEIDSALLEALE